MSQDESFTAALCGTAAARVERALAGSRGDPARGLHHYTQLDPILRRVNQILFRAQVAFGRLDRRVAVPLGTGHIPASRPRSR